MIGTYVAVAGLNGMALVALAAYGAHGSGAAAMPHPDLYQTAWQLHATHAAVLAALGMCRRPNAWLHGAFWLMLGGMFFFSASLYAQGTGILSGGSVITPTGGVMLMAGWFALAIAGVYRMGHQGGEASWHPGAVVLSRQRRPTGEQSHADAADGAGAPLHGLGRPLSGDRSRDQDAGGRG